MKKINRHYESKIQSLFTGIAKSITSHLHAPKIISAIMKQIDIFYHPDNWSLFLVDKTTKELYFAVAKGLDKRVMRKIRLKVGEGIAGYVAKTKKELYIPNVIKDPRFSKKIDKISGFKTQSIIAVPIIYRHEVLGVIELINTISRKGFSKTERDILKIIADFSAIALMNAATHDFVSRLAESDPLTGIFNRNNLENVVRQCKNKNHRNTKKYAVVAWIDIDYFKEVNDQFGHKAGDEVLQKTAYLLKINCRETDLIFRIGGDEFLILVLNKDENEIKQIEQHLGQRLRAMSQQVHPAPGLSFGIASGLNCDLQNIIIKADHIMYENKHKLTDEFSTRKRKADLLF